MPTTLLLKNCLRLASALLLAVSLCACEGYAHRFAAPYPAPGTVVNWPGVPYSEVRAFCYDYTAGPVPDFLHNGKMHPGVMDPRGVKLTSAQMTRLMRAITVSQPKGDRSPCYKPHHAFVFYGAKGQVVAVFEMCFGCNRQKSWPAGTPEYIDRQALWDLTAELGLPLGEGNAFYTQACRRR